MTHAKTRGVMAACVLSGLAMCASAKAVVPTSFNVFENASSVSLAGLTLSLNTAQNAPGTIDFVFGNTSVAPNALASIDDIYFEQTALSSLWLSAGSVFGSTGSVNFGTPAAPGSLPGGVNIAFGPNLFTAGRNGGASNGVGPGDTLTIRFTLGGTYAQFLTDWGAAPDSFRIGMHVQRLGLDGAASVGAVTVVPSPTGAIALAAAGGLMMVRRRRAES